ncbi:hypothetical protein RchiOBHm_Chr7g0184871 [Rosa chinensis]|uniref:Uncharacterized protein n=1 Tax=Rosa chinensis TaxID=74649 RepID=A0A2P6P3H3_ROSCH|nr:hypothetical protein RchiOBHm_Chr7g0184871 [Rosa chinensis]
MLFTNLYVASLDKLETMIQKFPLLSVVFLSKSLDACHLVCKELFMADCKITIVGNNEKKVSYYGQ